MSPLAYNLLLGASCLYALLRGGGPERVCATAFLIATLLTVLVVRPEGIRFASTDLGILTVDVALLILLVGVAIAANRLWPMVMAAMQLVEVAGHIARASPIVMPYAYATILAIWSYPMLLLLIVATYRHRRRIAKAGSDPSWRRFSDPRHPRTQSSGPTG